jgi:nitrogen fixation protein FixH
MTIRIHWGIAVAVFYAAFALSTVGFVVFAMTQEVQLVSDDYYARSLAHDGHMQAVANADALGSTLRVDVRPEARVVHVQWPAGLASQVRGVATMYRPSNARADRSVPLVPGEDGALDIPTTGLAPGLWRLQLRWSAAGRDYYVERDLRLP